MKNYFLSAKKFLDHYNIKETTPDLTLLSLILNAFKQIPYENISKIVKSNENKSITNAFRLPDILVEEHLSYGLGGTCFSLTYLLKQVLDYCGFASHILLADRTYGINTHCCIFVEIENNFYLSDVGYLIFTPKLMPKETGDISHFFYGNYNYKAVKNEGNIDIYSIINHNNYNKFRYRIKLQHIDNDTFFDAWKESFKFDMMNHVIINTYCGDNHIYIKDFNFHENTKQIKQSRFSENIVGISKIQWDKAISILGLNNIKR